MSNEPYNWLAEPTKKAKHMKRGDRWGKLECVNITAENMTLPIGNGFSETRQHLMADIKCTGFEGGGVECKKAFLIMLDCEPPKSEVKSWTGLLPIRFPGKRVMRDCGCMSRKLGGPELWPTIAVTLSLSVPEFLHMRIDKLAQDRIEKMSEVIRELLTRGLNHMDNGGSLDRHWQGRGTNEDKRISMCVRVTNTLMIRVRERKLNCGGVGLSTVAMALIDLGLDLVEEERERDFREAHQKKDGR